MKEFIENYLKKLNEVLEDMDKEAIEQVKDILFKAWRRDNQIFIMGNGGSASTSSHMACDIGKGSLSNEFNDNMKRFKIMSLNDNHGFQQ